MSKKHKKQSEKIEEQRAIENNDDIKAQKTVEVTSIGTKAAGFAYLMCIVFSIVFSLILTPLYKIDSFMPKMGAYIILQVMFVGVVAVVAMFTKANPIKEFNFKKTAHYSSYLIFGFTAVAVLFCFTMFANAFELGLFKIGYNVSADANQIVPHNVGELFMTIFTIALLPAIFEEVVFRGIIFKGTLQYGTPVAVILSTLCFTLFHGSIEQTVYQAVLGVELALAYYVTGDIKVNMLMHFLNNAVVLIYTYFMGAGLVTSMPVWQIVVAFILVAVGCGLIYLSYFAVKKLKKETTPIVVIKEEKHSNVLLIIAIFMVLVNWIFNTLVGFGINFNFA